MGKFGGEDNELEFIVCIELEVLASIADHPLSPSRQVSVRSQGKGFFECQMPSQSQYQVNS